MNPPLMRNDFLDYKSMIEKSHEWFFVVDSLGTYVWSSKRVEDITGYTQAEIVGKSFLELIPEREHERVRGFLDEISLKYSEYTDFEMVFLSKSGEEVYTLTSGTPLFDADGEYYGYRGSIRDITEQTQRFWKLDQSKRMWDRTQKALKIGSWEYNNLTKAVHYSDEMFRIFEVEKTPPPHDNQAFMSKIHPDDIQAVMNADIDLLEKPQTRVQEFRIMLDDSRIKHCKQTLQSMEDDFGSVVLLTGTLQDISEIKAYQKELNRKIKLEHYLGKMAESFVNVKKDKEVINKVLKDFSNLTNADRAYIFEFDFKTNTMSNTHEWCSDGVNPQKSILQNIPVDPNSYWMNKYKNKEFFILRDIENLPTQMLKERDHFSNQNIKSLVSFPIFCNDSLWGFFGLDNVKTSYKWDDETLTVIRIFAQIFQNFIEKRLADKTVKDLLHKVQDANKDLERAVQDRTQELKASIDEMNRTSAHFELALKVSDIGLWVWDFVNEPVPESFSFSKFFSNVVKPGTDSQSKNRFQYEQSSLVSWEASVHPDHWDRVFREKLNYLEGLTDEFSIDYKIWLNAQADWRWINSTGVIIDRDHQGRPTLMVGTYKDITGRKETELLLKNAKTSAEKKVKNKTEFLSNLNHELRTPLTIIIGNSETLLYSDIKNEYKGFIKTLHRSALKLLELIEEIVDLSKIDEDKIKPKYVSIKSREFFSDIYEYHKELAEKKGIELLFNISEDFPEHIQSDPKLLSKICNNLLGNAIKFTSQGFVSLDVSYEKPSYVIKVTDTGIGIAKEKLAMIFERFSQADSSSKRRYGGTGLGLAIAESAATILKGKIEVESELKKGSSFSLILPERSLKK